ncbi:uncharacterized protein LOC106181944 [Lingula anatina]|uniref:Uncharacterized protein LOC106181944 n=1 Tax=Lingula anatina TaxID=7574 RepID=A0A1S3KIC4_LINAN|nr:uncharacterized protein LOC106181944 [Lingula anatina]|eukprot:XP_013421966.1 uncharacterized protein LOC106181944 [Lingula anatina]
MPHFRSVCLVLVVLSAPAVDANHFDWLHRHNTNQCSIDGPELGVYDHTFIFVMDGIFNGIYQDFEQFSHHQKCAGRVDNQSIIEEGKKALQYFTEYGFDMSTITDLDLLDGRVTLEGSNLLFHPFCLHTETKFRIMMETDGHKSRFYKRAALYDYGWALEIMKETSINSSRYTGTVGAGGHILYGEYQSLTGLEYGTKDMVLIHYETQDPNSYAGGHFYVSGLRVYSDIYGEGQSYGLYDFDQETSKINGREMLTFPRRR